MNPKTDQSYTAQSIIVLEGLAPVRKRPAMYIGTTSQTGVNHCLNEIIDNSIDEALAGFCKNIEIRIEANNYLTVVDNGRGIPIEIMPQYKTSALEIVMTKLHAGGKFQGGAYKISGGLHGVGASVVNALSKHFIVEVARDGKVYRQEYEKGKPLYPVKQVEKSSLGLKTPSGTAISFLPDNEIFKETIEVNYHLLKKQIKERAYLIEKVFFKIDNLKNEEKIGFYFDGGIISFINDLNRGKKSPSSCYFNEKTSR